MPLLSSPVPSLVNGVSQQAATLRLASELEAQENAYSSIVEGLGKRSPTKHIKKLHSGDVSDAHFHLINRSATEQYQVVISNGDLKVFDLATGSEKSVLFPQGKAYLNTSSSPKLAMRALSVADYTYIVNSEVETAMSGELSPSNLGKALVSVKQGQYGTNYRIRLDGVVATEFTTSASALAQIQTDYIAQALITNLGSNTSTSVTTANWHEGYTVINNKIYNHILSQSGAFDNYSWHRGDTILLSGGTGITPGTYGITGKIDGGSIVLETSPSGGADLSNNDITSAVTPLVGDYTFTRSGSSILIEKTNGTALDVSVEDSYGNQAIKVATDTVQRFTDLPVVAPAGFTTKVTGDSSASEDDYYVTFVPLEASQTFGNGNWVETIGSSVETTFDLSTMPHVLIREPDGSFSFEEAAWVGRTVGDTDSCPDPSFIGHTIQDIFFYRNRLGVLSQENVITTVSGGFFKFFRESVASILDSDPIDQAATQAQVAILKRALPFHEELLLFADKSQLVMTSTGLLTPTTATINQATDYQSDLTARPVGAGDNIYFAFPRGAFSGVREYFVQNQTNTKGASDVTGHVPKYIDGTITQLAVSTSEDLVVALSDGLPNGLYIYKYYWANDQKLQSSWSKYTFESSCQVLTADFINSTLYLVIQRSDGYHLETQEFQAGQVDTDSTFVTLLDRRLDESQVTSSYNASTHLTSWVLPYTITGTMRVTVRAGDNAFPEGANITLSSQSGSTIQASGDFTGTKVFIGQVYRGIMELSPPVLREQSPNGGQTAILEGHYGIRNLTVSYNDTAYFEMHVALPGRDTKVKVFSSLTLGSDAAGEVALKAGKQRTLVGSEASRVSVSLISDSHLPCHFSAASWEGSFTQRSQRA
jgi:hypothetical protein